MTAKNGNTYSNKKWKQRMETHIVIKNKRKKNTKYS